MTTYSGYSIDSFDAAERATKTYTDDSIRELEPIFGDITKNSLVVAGSASLDGVMHDNVHEITFAGKVFYTPAEIDAGLIGTDLAYSVSFWNAGETDRTLVSITSTSASGWSISSPSAPYVLRPETVTTWTLTVLADGPPTQETTVYFTFNDGSIYTIDITGRRIEVFAFPIDAAGGLKLRYQFETVVSRSFQFREQRRSLRNEPFRTIDAKFVFFSHEEREKFLAKARLFYNKVIAVPYYPEELSFSTDPQGLSAIVVGDASNRFELENAEFLVIYNENDSDNAELLIIDTISGNTINLTSPVVGSYDPRYCYVAPAFMAICPEISGILYSPLVTELNVTFKEYQ